MHGFSGFVWRLAIILAVLAQVPAFNITVSGTLSLTGADPTDSLEALQGLQLILDLLPRGIIEGINLDIRDDAGSAEEVRRQYADMLQDAHAPVGPDGGYNLRVFIGPISRELSEVAANLTSSHSVPILLPFVSLPEKQRNQGYGRTLINSLEVPPELFMRRPLQTLHARGAKTVAIWESAEPYFAAMCQGAATAATAMGMTLVYRHSSSAIDNVIEDMRKMAAEGPDVFVVCAEYKQGVELMMSIDFLHFSPKAILMWDSATPEFSEALLVASALHILAPEIWSSRIEPCTIHPCDTSVTRKAFAAAYQSRYNMEPSLSAAQAAAAAMALTVKLADELESILFSNSVAPAFRQVNTEIQLLLLECDATRDSFYQLLCFNSQGFLVSSIMGVSQLVAVNASDGGRRLQGSLQPPQADIISTGTLLAYTRLTPQLLEVYQISQASSLQLPIAYPRPSEDSRELMRYPCEDGFEVVTSALFRMLANIADNTTGQGPSTPCTPCLDGSSRDSRSPICTACPAGTQATSQGQSECKDCLQGAVCDPANSTLVVAPDYYYFHGLLFSCTVKGRCLGGNLCAGNSSGALCLQCQPGLVLDPDSTEPDPCRPCGDEWRDTWHGLIIGICVYLVAFAWLLASHVNACKSLSSTSASTLRSLVNYFQFTAITAKIMTPEYMADFLPNTQGYFRVVAALVLDPIEEIPVSCFIPMWKPYQVKVLIGFCILPLTLLISLLLLFAWEFILAPLLFQSCSREDSPDMSEEEQLGELHGQRVSQTTGRSVHHTHSIEFHRASRARPSLRRLLAKFSEASMIWCHLLLPMSVFNMLGAVLCLDPQVAAVTVVDYPQPVNVLLSDLGLPCDDPSHQPWLILAVVGLAAYGLAIPWGLLLIVRAMYAENWLSERATGYFLHGARPGYLYTGLLTLMVIDSAAILSTILTLGRFLRLQGLLGVYCIACLVLSWTRPYDERDHSVLLRLEVTGMACQLLGVASMMIGAPWGGSGVFAQFSVLTEAVQIPANLYFFFVVLWSLINNAVIKSIRYAPDVEDLVPPLQRLHAFFDMHSDKVVYDVHTQELDISGLSRSSRSSLRAALSGAMERYFEAAAQGLVPWSEVGVENDFEQVVMDEEDGSKGLLYIGFLSAAVREMMLEVEQSRAVRYNEMRRASSLFQILRKFFASASEAGAETADDAETDAGIARGISFLEARQEVLKKPKLSATTEELYMAGMLVMRSIEEGSPVLYNMQSQQGPSETVKKHHDDDVVKPMQEWQADQPIEAFLEELTVTTKQPEDDDGSHAAEYFEVPEVVCEDAADQDENRSYEEAEAESIPSAGRETLLAHTLGLQSASSAREEYSVLLDEHDQCFAEIFELKAEIQDLRRRIVEAQAELHGMDHVMSREQSMQSEQLSREGADIQAKEVQPGPGVRQSKSTQSTRGHPRAEKQRRDSQAAPRSPRRHTAHNSYAGYAGEVVEAEQDSGSEESETPPPESRLKPQSESRKDKPVAKSLQASLVPLAQGGDNLWARPAT